MVRVLIYSNRVTDTPIHSDQSIDMFLQRHRHTHPQWSEHRHIPLEIQKHPITVVKALTWCTRDTDTPVYSGQSTDIYHQRYRHTSIVVRALTCFTRETDTPTTLVRALTCLIHPSAVVRVLTCSKRDTKTPIYHGQSTDMFQQRQRHSSTVVSALTYSTRDTETSMHCGQSTNILHQRHRYTQPHWSEL